jgi:hypothetical protein
MTTVPLFKMKKLLYLTALFRFLLLLQFASSFSSQTYRLIPQLYNHHGLFASRSSSTSGPRGGGKRQQRRSGRGGTASSASSPKGGGRGNRERTPRNRAPGPFDGKAMVASQSSNEKNAAVLDLSSPSVRDRLHCMTEDMQWENTALVNPQPPFKFHSLDEVLGIIGFSTIFNGNKDFRVALRAAIRQDIFDTTPFYEGLPEKAAAVLLLPDSSLEGSWKKAPNTRGLRMKQTTNVLRKYLDEKMASVVTGDDLFARIGALCGSKPSTHFIDIFGVQDRQVNHSWHQDFGQSPESSRTVLWGFPNDDDYFGCGVFSHVVSLNRECLAPPGRPRIEPVLFKGKIDEKYIVRPEYRPGREILTYRDVDVLHSSPDVAYRMSLMRFM